MSKYENMTKADLFAAIHAAQSWKDVPGGMLAAYCGSVDDWDEPLAASCVEELAVRLGIALDNYRHYDDNGKFVGYNCDDLWGLAREELSTRFDAESFNYSNANPRELDDAELAKAIRDDDSWDYVLVRDLCWRADMLEDFLAAPGDGFPDDVVYAAADALGVKID